MNILIIPKVYCRYKGQIEYSFEKRYYFFIKKVFPKAKIEIGMSKYFTKKPDLIILTGGNNIVSFSKKEEDLERNKIDNFFFKFSRKHNLPIIGICHGAQFIAKKFKSQFQKSKNHLKDHYIYLNKKKILVNSYHNIIITNVSNNLNVLAKAEDNTIEAFNNIKFKIAGIIWHPERFTKYKKEDINLIKKFYAACNISIRKRK